LQLNFIPARLPNPFSLPPGAFPKTRLPLTVNEGQPDLTKWKREVFFWFFSIKEFGGKMRVVSG
jgi:hypothetical protein